MIVKGGFVHVAFALIKRITIGSASIGAKRTSTGCSAPYRGGAQDLSSTYEKAHVELDLLTLASSYYII